MAGMLQMRRSRGALSGLLLVLLGLWGALIPFVGPYFHYAYTPDTGWTYTTARLWLEILPGAAVFLGGVLLIIARSRYVALFGAMLAAAAGAWFVLGTSLSPLWNNHVTLGGSPASATVYMRIMEQLGFFSALGVVIVFIAAMAIGRIASVPSGIRAAEPVSEPVREPVTEPVRAPVSEPVREPVSDSTVPAETVPVRRVTDVRPAEGEDTQTTM